MCQNAYTFMIMNIYFIIHLIYYLFYFLSHLILPSLENTMPAPFPTHTDRKICGMRGLAQAATTVASGMCGLMLLSKSIRFIASFTASKGKLLSPTWKSRSKSNSEAQREKSVTIKIFHVRVLWIE